MSIFILKAKTTTKLFKYKLALLKFWLHVCKQNSQNGIIPLITHVKKTVKTILSKFGIKWPPAPWAHMSPPSVSPFTGSSSGIRVTSWCYDRTRKKRLSLEIMLESEGESHSFNVTYYLYLILGDDITRDPNAILVETEFKFRENHCHELGSSLCMTYT